MGGNVERREGRDATRRAPVRERTGSSQKRVRETAGSIGRRGRVTWCRVGGAIRRRGLAGRPGRWCASAERTGWCLRFLYVDVKFDRSSLTVISQGQCTTWRKQRSSVFMWGDIFCCFFFLTVQQFWVICVYITVWYTSIQNISYICLLKSLKN